MVAEKLDCPDCGEPMELVPSQMQEGRWYYRCTTYYRCTPRSIYHRALRGDDIDEFIKCSIRWNITAQ